MAKKIYKYTQYPPFYTNQYGWGGDSLKTLNTAFNQQNAGSNIAGIGGALTSIVGAGVNNAQIGDTSSIENNIQNTQNLKFSGLTNDALMQSWQQYNPLNNVSYKDVRGGSNSQRIMSTLGAGISGASTGATVGGPWGAAIGGAIGLGSGIWGLLSGNKKANAKTAELNAQIAQANQQALNNFGNSVQNVDANNDMNLLANYRAYGGYLGKDDNLASTYKQRLESIRGPMNDDYDYTGYYIKYPKQAELMLKGDKNAHFTDEFKLPNHATFSDESIYSKQTGGGNKEGGHWDYKNGKEIFVLSEDNFLNNPDLGSYFQRNEPNSLPIYKNGILLPQITVYGNKKEYSGKMNKMSNGGHTHGAEWDNSITLFDNGNTHEQNPNGGVQIGVDPQGVPNMVEEGEVRYNDYIFSNRITMPKEFKKQYKLKNNSTFADAAKKLSKESEERPNDPISKSGLDASMTKLVSIQEAIKAEQQPKQQVKQQPNIFGNGTIQIPKFKPGSVKSGVDMYPDKQIPSFTMTPQELGINMSQSNNGVDEEYWNTLYKTRNIASDPLKFNTSTLRYAPVLGAGIGVFSDLMGWTNKPDYSNADMIAQSTRNLSNVEFNPLENYMAYKPLDRNYYLNQLYGNAGATRRDIINQSGGNRATAMAGLLGADYNTNSNIGKLAREAEEYNLSQRQKVEDFNRSTNMFNSEGSMKAQMANKTNEEMRFKSAMAQAEMRDKADILSSQARTANLTNLFDSIGDIGRESYARNMIMSNPALYYTIDNTGKVTYKDDYYKLSPQEKDYVDYDASKKNQNKTTNTKAKGGYLTIKKR